MVESEGWRVQCLETVTPPLWMMQTWLMSRALSSERTTALRLPPPLSTPVRQMDGDCIYLRATLSV
jgi:hypothetical protein